MKNLNSFFKTIFVFIIFCSFDGPVSIENESNLIQTIESRENTFFTLTSIEFKGYKEFSNVFLLNSINLDLSKKIIREEIDRGIERLRRIYKDKGYNNVDIQYSLDRSVNISGHKLIIEIRENYQSKISNIFISGVKTEKKQKNIDELLLQFKNQVATKNNFNRIENLLRIELRKQGYLQSRVDRASIDYQELSGDVDIYVNILLGRIYSFEFLDNQYFNDEQLFSLLEVEKKKGPYSSNLLNYLAGLIIQAYREEGFLDVEIVTKILQEREDKLKYELKVKEGLRHYIKRVSFVGNAYFEGRVLRRLISTKKKGHYLKSLIYQGILDEEQLEKDKDNIVAFYKSKGFPDIQVDVYYEVDPLKEAFELKFLLNEGGTAKIIKSLDINWVQDPDANEIDIGLNTSLLTIRPQIEKGDPIDLDKINAEARAFEKKFRDNGYPLCKVESEVDLKLLKVSFNVKLGPYVYFDSYRIYSSDKISKSFYDRYFSDMHDLPWSDSIIEEARQSLYSTGLFSSVQIVPHEETFSASSTQLDVHVVERETGFLNLGAGANTQDGIHLQSQISERNFFNTGNSFSLGADIYLARNSRLFNAGRANIAYLIPKFYAHDYDFLSEVYAQLDINTIEQFSYDRFGASFVLQRNQIKRIKNSFGYFIFKDHVFDLSSDVQISEVDRGSRIYSGLDYEIDIDKRDDRYNPFDGYRVKFNLGLVSEFFGSNDNIIDFSVKGAKFFKLSENLLFKTSLTYQLKEGIWGTDVVPISQRYFIGGHNSIRGYSRYSLGPRGIDSNPVGGDRALVASAEFFKFITDEISLNFFFDAGNSILKNKGSFTGFDTSFSQLKASPGLGLGYKTPIGRLGIEYGVAIDRDFGEAPGQLYVGFGQEF